MRPMVKKLGLVTARFAGVVVPVVATANVGSLGSTAVTVTAARDPARFAGVPPPEHLDVRGAGDGGGGEVDEVVDRLAVAPVERPVDEARLRDLDGAERVGVDARPGRDGNGEDVIVQRDRLGVG